MSSPGPKPRLFALRCWILEWLLVWRISSGDHRSTRRLLALYRLQRMYRWREYRELLELAESHGLRLEVSAAIVENELRTMESCLAELRRETA